MKLYSPKTLSDRYKGTEARASVQQITLDIRLGKLNAERIGASWIIRESQLQDYFREKIYKQKGVKK